MVFSLESRVKATNAFESVLSDLDQMLEQRERFDVIEKELLARVRQLGLVMLQAGVDDVAVAETAQAPDVIERVDDRDLKQLDENQSRRLVTIFGELTINGPVYAVRARQRIERAPVAARLGLPAGEFSYLFQDWAQRLCVRNAFHDSRDLLDELLGQKVSVRTLEHMNQQLAVEVEAFRDQQAAPASVDEGELLVVSADATGVPMVHRGGKMQMAYIGACYTIDRHVRSVDDILDETLRQASQQKRPRPRFKRLHADLTRARDEAPETVIDGRLAVFTWLETEIESRRRDGSMPVVCLMDGEQKLWARKAELLEEDVIEVLDFWHFQHRLREVSKIFTTTDAQAEKFLEARLRRVLEGEINGVIHSLRCLLTRRKLRGEKRQTVESAITYFNNNRHRLRYDQYIAAGYPIASGAIEGSCRHVVKDRLDQTGMRWEQPGAVAMLQTRCLSLSDDWQDYQTWRINKEQQHLYTTP